jgi:hypothetical protein
MNRDVKSPSRAPIYTAIPKRFDTNLTCLIDESRVEVELIDLVKFRPEAIGWHLQYPQGKKVNSTRF